MNLKLARIAAEQARKNYQGETLFSMGNLQVMENLFRGEEDVAREELNRDWSGAFVYHCVSLAGIALPAHYPDPRVSHSFAFVSAWEQYARLPKIGIWHRAAEMPEVGDLAIFEAEEGKAPRMGIVLSIEGESLEIAVGNHRNHSAIIEQQLWSGIRGYVRLKA